VLGKPQDFKESKDANVRVEVHRLRKRLAEFYENEGAAHCLRIVIPMGQYVPQFLMHEDRPAAGIEPAIAHESVALSLPAEVRQPWWAFARIAIPGLVVVLAIGFLFFDRSESPLDSFWRPMFSSSNQVLICVGNLEGGRRTATVVESESRLTIRDFHHLSSQMINLADAATLARFAGFLQAKKRPYRVVSQSEATFSDLQSSPAVLIGLMNNDWTQRLVGKLRFSVERSASGRIVLRDRDHPARDDWSMDYSTPYLEVNRDYALVLRVLDPKTEQMVVTAAGISVFGTLAAGEFLTSPNEFRKLEAVAPKDWRKKNFEIVLATDVIRGKGGHPSIVAAHFW
jgi:hypothetical protein